MRGQEPLMSSARTGIKEQDEWRTPRWLFDRCVKEFGSMDIDAAADLNNSFCGDFFSIERSALAVDARWSENVWCNPPYSMLRQFAAKAIEQLEVNFCDSVTFLIPSRTDTRAFQMLSKWATAIIFLAGRVRFDDREGNPAAVWNEKRQTSVPASAPFPSAIIHLRGIRVDCKVSFKYWRQK